MQDAAITSQESGKNKCPVDNRLYLLEVHEIYTY